jgi:hypothetical protein
LLQTHWPAPHLGGIQASADSTCRKVPQPPHHNHWYANCFVHWIIHELLMSRWTLCPWSGMCGAWRYGKARNHSPALHPTHVAQWALESTPSRCKTSRPSFPFCMSIFLQPGHETGLEEVVRQVADFKWDSTGFSQSLKITVSNHRKPTGTTGKGMYELKEESYEQYNPFFYHYSRSERSKVGQ